MPSSVGAPKRPVTAERIHLGCDTVRIDGFHHVDVRATEVVDTVHHCRDLHPFADESAKLIFSNAFLEHLRVDDRVTLLRDAVRTLRPDGQLLFTGLPDFAGIARAYLEQAPGNVSTAFDLFEVYRYTHGAPEGKAAWWYAQLHKGLFDTPTVLTLVAEAGFSGAQVFSYAWGDEPNPVNLGFVAWRSEAGAPSDPFRAAELLEGLPVNANEDSITLTGRSAPPPNH